MFAELGGVSSGGLVGGQNSGDVSGEMLALERVSNMVSNMVVPSVCAYRLALSRGAPGGARKAPIGRSVKTHGFLALRSVKTHGFLTPQGWRSVKPHGFLMP